MNLYDIADLMEIELGAVRFPGQNHWSVEFDDSMIKAEPGLLGSCWGTGETVELAMESYVRQLRGKVLVLNHSNTENRKEIRIPENLMCSYDFIQEKIK